MNQTFSSSLWGCYAPQLRNKTNMITDIMPSPPNESANSLIPLLGRRGGAEAPPLSYLIPVILMATTTILDSGTSTPRTVDDPHPVRCLPKSSYHVLFTLDVFLKYRTNRYTLVQTMVSVDRMQHFSGCFHKVHRWLPATFAIVIKWVHSIQPNDTRLCPPTRATSLSQ